MKLKSIKQVIDNDFCLGCGLCSVIDSSIKVNEIQGKYRSTFTEIKGKSDHIAVCPGSGYDIYELGKELHHMEHYSYELGWYKGLTLARTKKEELHIHASSGGMMTAIALYMLESHQADGVICTQYTYLKSKVRPVSYIAHNKAELLESQGSKYCPTKPLILISQLKKNEKYVLIGTPCQIAGWRKYNKYYKDSDVNIVLTIANFCGGYRDFREIDYYVTRIAKFSDVVYFQHRGDGAPGQMRIENKAGEVWTYPYPDYAKLSPIAKNNRCAYCIDATGELADISCGDAWLNRFKQTAESWSCIIFRNSMANEIISKMIAKDLIEVSAISEKEVIESQKCNITSKKYRQFKRMRIRSIFLRRLPDWHGCVKDVGGTYINEFRIVVSKFVGKLRHKKDYE